ncbi:MAG: hypothetical protein A2Y52_07505 [Sulfuricurvum sp. RIFCSPLOWO2_02_43_6]|nr:MAG: hypothetical protein A2Y52_07505 [Sulfuricurvum sp. RIFCSPLOWO2_02_43_6]
MPLSTYLFVTREAQISFAFESISKNDFNPFKLLKEGLALAFISRLYILPYKSLSMTALYHAKR